MSKYFINFTEEIGEVRVKPCSNDTGNDPFTSHGTLYKHLKKESYMIKYYGVSHKAQETLTGCFLFSHKKTEYYAELEQV